MDSYDQAKRRLDLITSEAGWYVYCVEEEEWHLYNEDGDLLFSAPTIEELADSKQMGYCVTVGEDTSLDTRRYGKRMYTPPLDTKDIPQLEDYEERTRTNEDQYGDRHGEKGSDNQG